MNKLDYFKMKTEAIISPMDFMKASKGVPDQYVVVDVRNAPPQMKERKILGAIEIPQMDLADRSTELPKDKTIVVYCWDVWCNLGAKAALELLGQGYDVIELSGGIAAWNTLKLPTEAVE